MDRTQLTRGLRFSPEVAPLVARMPAVDAYREAMLRLQGAWDSLSMLGQMSGAVPDIGATRSAFEALTGTLLDNLARRQLGNLRQRLAARAQVAIDILVRNLFERTADIGFLATDLALREHLGRFHAHAHDAVPEDARAALEARLRAYVAKYSVYDDIVLLSREGQVLARLDRTARCTRSTEPWIAEALQGRAYVEQHGRLELFDGRPALIYASAVRGQVGDAAASSRGAGVAGVLCLSFRLDNEVERICTQLLGEASDGSAIALLDAGGRVVGSSDIWQLPIGAPIRAGGPDAGASHRRFRFAGREYLGVAAQPSGYEGYAGPGWSALALVPIDAAFEEPLAGEDDSDGEARARDDGELASRLDTRGLFDAELLSIGPQARRIESDLARLLWNGKLERRGDAGARAFADTLLGEVGQTGERIRRVFDDATGALYRSTLQAVFDQARDHARLAVDIVDRNLYERANDCRWWALDGVLRATLAAAPQERDTRAATAVLRQVNGLYTVYSLLLLFDASGRVVAVSRDDAAASVGTALDAPWVGETLALRDPQKHAVSRHLPSPVYGGRATFVYAAALRAPGSESGAPLGGIAIVFDGAPQFTAMLRDALPREASGAPASGAFGLLVSRAGEVLASTDARWPVGSQAPQPRPWAALARGDSGSAVVDLDGVAHAVGYALAGGYREYPVAPCAPPDDPVSLMLVPLGPRLAVVEPLPPEFRPPTFSRPASSATEAALRIASLRVGREWLGLPTAHVVEAVGGVRLTALPNAPRALVGMLAFDGRMLPVLDLGLLRGADRPGAHDAPLVVVEREDGERLALRVDGLGPVFELAPEAVQRVRCGSASAGGIERLVGSEGHALSLIEPAALWGALARGRLGLPDPRATDEAAPETGEAATVRLSAGDPDPAARDRGMPAPCPSAA